MSKQIILWDFDGTLAYTGADVWVSLQYAAEILGGKIPEYFRKEDSNLGKSVKEIYGMITPYPGDENYERYDELVRVHYRKQNEFDQTFFYEGIRILLLRLKMQGAKNRIITMKPREALERILEKKDWEFLFEDWYSPDSFPGEEKTKSELIAYVMQQDSKKRDRQEHIEKEKRDRQEHIEKEEQGAAEQVKYIYIGDTWSDVRAAHENQIPCIAVTYGDGDTKRLLAEEPEYAADSAAQITDILMTI